MMMRHRLLIVVLLMSVITAKASPFLGEREVTDISPLLTCHWHQRAPYNGLCPVVADGNVKTVAGCVAIATAQIIYYWRTYNPLTTAYDTPTYPYGMAPVTYSIPAGTPFEWELIKDTYTDDDSEASRQAVARLVFITGSSAWLTYGSSTGGNIFDVINALAMQFQIQAQYAIKKNYTQQEWESLLYNELAHGRPVLYSGSKGNTAHAVVIDGYDAKRNLFHFNFGWGGDEDGYYTVDDETGMDGYCQGQRCVYGILPKSIADNETCIAITTKTMQLNLSHGSENLLIVKVAEPTTVSINRMDGSLMKRLYVNCCETICLPHGLYIINGRKWLQ